MIKSKGNKTVKKKNTTNNFLTNHSKVFNLDAVVKNYRCLFCKREIYINDIYTSSCKGCESQWFEKLMISDSRVVDAI